jgi:transcriptional regulator with XRE-family HTH domain
MLLTIITRIRTFLGAMGKSRQDDPVMATVRERFAKSGLTQQELGERMGYAPSTARQSVSQFLKSGDPQIGMLRRFAHALGISVKSLL